MVQNHMRYSPLTCPCVIDVLIDDITGVQSLFAIKKICDAHKGIATPDPNFETKKTAALQKRYQDLDDNLNNNLVQIAAYTDAEVSAADRQALINQVQRITAERKAEYDALLSQPDSNLVFCTNVHDSVLEESGRWPKIYARVQSQFNLTDAQMNSITWSMSGNAPNRIFTVNFGGTLTTNQKNQIQTWANTNIGTGKVVIL